MKRSLYGVLAFALGVGLAAGCSSSGSAKIGSPTSTTSTTSTTTSGSTTTTTASSGSPTTTSSGTGAPTGPPQCATSQLTATFGNASGAAGTTYYQLTLTNAGAGACVIQGYPGVSFVAGSDQHQVGAAASRAPGTTPAVTLQAGQAASATVGIGDAANYPSSCQQTPVTGLRVYPPDQTASLLVSHDDNACANSADATLRVYALQPAT